MACSTVQQKKHGQRKRQRLALLLATTVVTVAGAAGSAGAQAISSPQPTQQSELRSYNIPAQQLRNGLSEFNRQSGIQVAQASGAIPAGIRTGAVSGRLTPQDALARLLAGTGLSYRFINADSVVISSPAQQDAQEGLPPDTDSATALETIVIRSGDRNAASGAGYQGTPDWVYETPAAVSVISREAIQNAPSRNARDLLDNVAGVYANRSEAQNPGIAVNIRGLQDQDRIVTMIDGARQSFQRGGHGTTQRTYVDTAFVRAVEIEKSSTSGVGSAGSLGGSVNFRTLVADDLIREGKDWGVELSSAAGTNGFRFDGSAAAAIRITDSLSVLGGVSRKKIDPYKIGQNGKITNHQTTATGDTLLFSGQEVISTILKAEIDVTETAKLTLGWVRNDSSFSTGNYSSLLGGILLETKQDVINNTLTAAFDWDPDTDLINLKARLYYNHVDNDDWTGIKPRNYIMKTFGGSIENTSHFDTALGRLSLNYGAEAFKDDAESNMPPFIVDGVDVSDFRNGGTPGGKRNVVSGFANAKLDHDDWLTVEGGVRYDWYSVAGSTVIYGNPTVIYHPPSDCIWWVGDVCLRYRNRERWETIPPQPHDIQIDRAEGALLPTMTVAVKPYDWLQAFAKYSRSFRPPTVMESFLASGHTNDGINTWSPNPYLKPERGNTWELGFNIAQEAIFTPDDRLRVKVVGFYREIDDYIALGRIFNEQTDRPYKSPVNLDGTTRMKGIEVEANYDARSFYFGGTLTYNKSDWADHFKYRGGTDKLGPNTAVIFVQPEIRVSLDAGVRLFDEKLTVGGRMTHVGKSEPTIGTLQQNYQLPAYSIFDLYGSYAFSDMAKLSVSVTNLTDKAYVSALGADYYAMPGRTFTASLNFKF